VIRHHANPPQPKKTQREPAQNKTIVRLVIDPMVNPGSFGASPSGSPESGSTAHIIAWSLWRRAHQAIAQRSHIKANDNCNARACLQLGIPKSIIE